MYLGLLSIQRIVLDLRYDLGDDTLQAIIAGKSNVLVEKYSDFFKGREVTAGDLKMVDHVANQIGGYAKMSQDVKSIAVGELSAGVDLSKSYLGKVLGIRGGMTLQDQRQAVENFSADSLKMGMQDNFAKIKQSTLTADQKAETFTKDVHSLYNLGHDTATKSKAQLLVEGAPDALVKADKLEQRSKKTEPKPEDWPGT